MSQVSKLINSIPLVTKEKKAHLTEDIITILAKETDTSTLPLLYNLSQSTSIEDRHCAAKLLYSIKDSFLIHFMPTNNLNLTFKNTYLESSGKKYNRKSKDYELQKQWIKSKMDLDINTLVQEEDFSVKEIRKDNLKEYDEDIQVIDEISFYKAIENNLLSSDWIKRHSAFLFFLALFSKNLEDDSFLGNLFVRKTCQSKKFNYEVTPFLINICLEILKEDKFSDFVNDQTVAPVRECASLLLAQLIDYSEVKELVLEKVYTLLESEDWQEQLSGLLVLKYLDGNFVCVHKQTVKKFDTKFCFCQKLNDLILCSQDEDIKYLSALIKHKLGCKVPPSVLTHALTQAYDISLSTAAILNLMDNVNQLPYKLNAGLFRHPLKEVRLSVVKLVIRSLENIHEFDQFNDLLENIIYNILVEENELISDLSVQSLIKLININNNISNLVYNFIKQPFYQRKENCFDEQYYSLTGVKQLSDTFLINKLKLLLPLIGKIPKIPCEKNIYCLLIDFDCTTDLFSKNELKKLEKKEIIHPKVREKYQEYLFCKVMNGDFLSLIELKECFRVYYFSYLLYKHKKILKNNTTINDNTISNYNNNINDNTTYINDITITNSINTAINDNSTITNSNNNNNTIFNDELIKFCFFNKIKEIFLVCKGMFFYDYFINELNLLSEIIEYVNKKEEVFYKCIEEIYNITISIENNTINNKDYNKDYNKDNIKNNIKNSIKHNKDNNKRVKDSIKDNNSVNYLTNIISYYIKNDLFYSDLLIDKLIKQFNYVLLERVLNNLEISYYILFVKEILNKSLNNLLSKILPYLCINKEIPSKHMSKIKEEREKMIDLVNNKCNDYEIKCPMVIKLRKYQVEGVNWISFLYKYGLKGILGDDMGLGKTVQVLTFICSEIYYHSTIGNKQIQDNNLTQDNNNLVYDNTKNNTKEIQDIIHDNNLVHDNNLNNKTSKKVKDNQMINYLYYNALILCPSTLVSHWYSEIKEYFPFINKEIKVLSYDQIKRSNFNYKTNYLVLDEGHLLRNKETVLYNKVSLIISDFKILLSGTPIQNNSSDLVNLINLMMKDYLNKSMDLTTLHSKTLSLVLRRLKTEVLEELPEKVISDVIIPMNDLQIKLYNCKEESNVKLGEEIGFKKIHNLLKVCNNPLEYVKNICDNKSLSDKIKEILNNTNISNNTTLLDSTSLLINDDLNNTSDNIISNNDLNLNITLGDNNDLNLMYNPKLISLIDLLKMIKEESKILIFCQSKSTIDLILPYLSDCVRLDGSVKEKDNVINQFKKEKRILIMTTTVGGLGLNLTCADTVIFYEHDWNPFNDLQAMDRAHRLGQKSTVNVLRLIMKDTIEERIMSHQQFKVFLANKLINYENQSVKSMNIKDVIDKIVDERNKEIEEVTEEEDFIY